MLKIFNDRRNNNKYRNKAKLYKKIISKALPIVQALYSKYLLLFFFDNTISHSVDAKNKLQVQDINKDIKSK